ncbi:type II toxin-antitoxin system RelE/ParE family toxin [Sphingomonas sp.]|uniref:type II toxin-antitoxin system RelE/ParE family toxin n=1 Tax=Sphingomonas sp. TaxID=28214 RepID=UPI0039C95DE1
MERRLVTGCGALGRFPHIGRPISDSNIWEFSFTDIQYVARYRIDRERAISILRVHHTHENREQP